MPRKTRASILLIVLVMICFTAFALYTFIDRASNDLLVEARTATANRLRPDAYSALEVTLGVLNEFIQTNSGLHSPAEGWGDPLDFAGYEPSSGHTIEVAFEDESGKLSLPQATATQLTDVFESWGVTESDAEQMADALLTWMRSDHVASTSAGTPDYDRATLPYAAPQRSLRSFDELAAIDFVNKKLYDENGLPNDLWKHFSNAFSLYNFSQSNLNGAGADTLAGLGQPNATTQQQLSDYLNGTGSFKGNGPGYFSTSDQANTVLGANAIPQGLGTQISALRILVTVHEESASFRLNAVVSIPPNGAKTVASTEQTSTSTTNSTVTSPTAPGATPAASTSSTSSNTTPPPQLNYPFTLLEIHEEIIDNAAKPPPSPSIAPST